MNKQQQHKLLLSIAGKASNLDNNCLILTEPAFVLMGAWHVRCRCIKQVPMIAKENSSQKGTEKGGG